MVRKIIVIIAAIAILVGGFAAAKKIAGSKKVPEKKIEKRIATVFTQTVKNGAVPINLSATGSLRALNRIDLYAEVQGVMLSDDGKFKPGTSFKKGQPLVRINSADFQASLKSQKSNLQNLITAALADLKLDYPASFHNWSSYASEFDVNSAVPELPEPTSDQEKMFITGRNIYTTYYTIKNAELVLSKYTIAAPFDGVLTLAQVNPGTVIRPGQKLGEFIDPSVYEMETPINSSMVQHLRIGQKVNLKSTSGDGSWSGQIVRINALVTPGTQMVNAYIRVAGRGLEEGLFLKAVIAATEIENAFVIERSVLFDDDQVFVAGDSLLLQKTVEPIYFNEKTVVVRGLKNGIEVLSKMAPGAYPGMRIEIYEEK